MSCCLISDFVRNYTIWPESCLAYLFSTFVLAPSKQSWLIFFCLVPWNWTSICLISIWALVQCVVNRYIRVVQIVRCTIQGVGAAVLDIYIIPWIWFYRFLGLATSPYPFATAWDRLIVFSNSISCWLNVQSWKSNMSSSSSIVVSFSDLSCFRASSAAEVISWAISFGQDSTKYCRVARSSAGYFRSLWRDSFPSIISDSRISLVTIACCSSFPLMMRSSPPLVLYVLVQFRCSDHVIY